tara:strand:- start:228 stop:869 length:642 start_codon:yes stop_codon:yes gene_type:complete
MNFAFIGGGGLGLETLSFFLEDKKKYNFKIFIVGLKISNKSLFKKLYKNIFFISKASSLPKKNTKICITIADPKKRKYFYDLLKNKFDFFSIIHRSAYISTNSKIGKGVVIAPKTVISPFSEISPNVYLNSGSIIGHNTKVNSNTIINPNAFIGGNCIIGSSCYIGPSSVITPNLKFGNNSKISSCSVLNKDAPPNILAHGNPAKINKIYFKS